MADLHPSTSPPRRRRRSALTVLAVAVAVALVALTGCGTGATSTPTKGSATLLPPASQVPPKVFPEGTTVKLITHDSFAVSDSVLKAFTDQTHVKVDIIHTGDAVTEVNRAILTAGNPEGDVLFGIDQSMLSSAFAAKLFDPYQSAGLASVPAKYQIDDQHRVTPIDHGDVCINFDRKAFTAAGLTVPDSFEALAQPDLKGKLVVEDPSASSPGLAFLLATIAHFGGGNDTSGNAAWLQYWKQLKANGVTVSNGWEDAYYGQFSGGSGKGDKPLVVSYASSPPAEVANADVPVDQTPTGVVPSTCYTQIEFAGVLRGTTQPDAAHALIDFLLSVPFQNDVPGQMYVYPVNSDAQLPTIFAKYTTPVPDPLQLPYDQVGANRDRWIQQWSSVFR